MTLDGASMVRVTSPIDVDLFAWRTAVNVPSSQVNASYELDGGSSVVVSSGKSATVFTQISTDDAVAHFVDGFRFA